MADSAFFSVFQQCISCGQQNKKKKYFSCASRSASRYNNHRLQTHKVCPSQLTLQKPGSMTHIGILSDTHITTLQPWYIQQVEAAFTDCSVILHAGDLTDISILDIFQGKEIHAVHGNMCENSSRQNLPTTKIIEIEGYSIGLCHGAGARHNIEERMWDLFPTVDCIVYGHTHMAVNHRLAKTLFINPGSFQPTGRYGAAGSYAILNIDKNGLHADLYEFRQN